MSFKKKIKKYLPDRVIRLYYTVNMVPKLISAFIICPIDRFPKVKFFSDEALVDYIVNEKCSLSRYGDGEFTWMSGENTGTYQDYSDEFGNALREAFQTKNPKVLIGLPRCLYDTEKHNLYAKMFWFITKRTLFPFIIRYIDFDKTYCDTNITRPYIDYSDYDFSAYIFSLLKKIWDRKDIVIVEGEKTKLGMGNDLLSNAASIRRILCPAKNAYARIEDIKKSIRKNVGKDTLILGALGPTASILAVQMADEGYWFVDIGHIDVEYMWFLNREIVRKPIKGKYVNESRDADFSGYYYEDDPGYFRTVIDKII